MYILATTSTYSIIWYNLYIIICAVRSIFNIQYVNSSIIANHFGLFASRICFEENKQSNSNPRTNLITDFTHHIHRRIKRDSVIRNVHRLKYGCQRRRLILNHLQRCQHQHRFSMKKRNQKRMMNAMSKVSLTAPRLRVVVIQHF